MQTCWHRSCKSFKVVFCNCLCLLFSKQELRNAKHKKTSQVSVAFHDKFVHVLCFKGEVITSGDIELSPGPVVTQGNNPNNVIELSQSRLAQHGLRILSQGNLSVQKEILRS